MLNIHERLGTHTPVDADAGVTLTYEQREKGRLKALTDNGEEVRLFLERGRPLAVGEVLKSECGRHLQVKGALEAVTLARATDWLSFSRACYHLGNRHTKVQVGELWLRIQPDHVLEDMLKGLGLSVESETAVFNPESGAYSHGHHHH